MGIKQRVLGHKNENFYEIDLLKENFGVEIMDFRGFYVRPDSARIPPPNCNLGTWFL